VPSCARCPKGRGHGRAGPLEDSGRRGDPLPGARVVRRDGRRRRARSADAALGLDGPALHPGGRGARSGDGQPVRADCVHPMSARAALRVTMTGDKEMKRNLQSVAGDKGMRKLARGAALEVAGLMLVEVQANTPVKRGRLLRSERVRAYVSSKKED